MDRVATASLGSHTPPLVRIARSTLCGIGVACVAVGLGADWIVGGAPGFGRGQGCLLLAGAATFIAAAVVRRPGSARWALRGVALLLSVYVGLVACDLLLQVKSRAIKNPSLGLRGMYVADARRGFRLVPNFDGHFDDGVTRCRYQINSLGHRDDEPTGRGERRVLLIGDSFAFGYRLDEGQTIDKQIEELSDGRLDVYNAGMQAYGPPAILETLRRCDWYEGDEVLYLFFGNDLRSDNLLPDMGLTAFDGFQVPRGRDDGTAYTTDEYARLIHERQKEPKPTIRRTISAAVRLSNLRELLHREDTATRLLDTQGPSVYRPEHVAAVVEICMEMAAVAAARGMRFSVAVLPTRGEVVHGEHSELVGAFIQELRRRDVPVVELLLSLGSEHYYDPPDIHINPAGARRVAAGLLEAVSTR